MPKPQFTAEQKAGLKDFWELTTKHEAELTADMMKVIDKLPDLRALVARMTPQQLEEQQKTSRELSKRAMVDDDWEPLMSSQRKQGATYAGMGIAFSEWFDLVSVYQRGLVTKMIEAYLKDPPRLARALDAMHTYLDLSMSVIGEEYLRTKERIIGQQQEAIAELSTPVLQVSERLLLIPVVGLLDTQRARRLTEQLLRSIRTHRAKMVVIDITGVGAVDSKVANHLLQTVTAARLMGAQSVVTGLSAEVAQALVALGVDVEKLRTVGDLQGGLEEANRLMGYRLVKSDGTEARS